MGNDESQVGVRTSATSDHVVAPATLSSSLSLILRILTVRSNRLISLWLESHRRRPEVLGLALCSEALPPGQLQSPSKNCCSKPPHRLKECERQTTSPPTRSCAARHHRYILRATQLFQHLAHLLQRDLVVIYVHSDGPIPPCPAHATSRIASFLDAAQPDQASHMVVNLLSAEQASLSVKLSRPDLYPRAKTILFDTLFAFGGGSADNRWFVGGDIL